MKSLTDDMELNLNTSLKWVEPLLPPLLMSPVSFSRIQRAARLLPRSAADFLGFECRLVESDSQTDCALNLTADGARYLAGRHEVALPEELRTESWQRVQRFYQEWGDTREPAYVDAGATWLEFDTASDELRPNLLFGYWPGKKEIRRSLPWLVQSIIPMLLGMPISQALQSNLLRCFELCPPGTDDFQVGLMIARHIQAVRLCVFDIHPDEAPAYLERVGWKGPMDEVRRTLEVLAPHADFMGLHLDVGEQLYPQIGIEPGFVAGPWARQPHLEPRWHHQFEQLVNMGLCTPSKRDALLGWVGHQRYPADSKDGGLVLLRGLSHLKIVLRTGAPALAKAYFGIADRPLKAGNGVA
ncbi:hypothetical protein [Hyalangium minutum]|uniref:Uncharacterized protein n=1 Tax=Hyalangium minutum TaxID=394096 RepID=A0A085W9J5_9BACT|nr:hypothetical protein [Hyalangium minutum]KFE64358.1 hypothetical protein DB31_2152 [Hyalangium minutum]